MASTSNIVLYYGCRMPYVGGQCEAEVSLGDMVPNILHAVVRNGEGLNREACNLKWRAKRNISTRGSNRVLHKATLSNAIMHQRRGIYG